MALIVEAAAPAINTLLQYSKPKIFFFFVVKVYPSFCSLKHYLKLFLERMLVDLWYFPAIYQVSKTVIWLGLPLFNVVLSVE